MNEENRRSFLKKGLVGLAGLTLAPSALAAGARDPDRNEKKERKIITRTLGKTGLDIPVISMGVMNADNPDLVRMALDMGITHLDTAHYYMMGRNEKMVGEVIKGWPRNSFILATKVRGTTVDRHTRKKDEEVQPESYRSFIDKFELSLQRLGLTYVDILYLHSVKRKEDVVVDHIVEAMIKLRKDGKVRHIGISTHQNEPEVIQAAADSGVYEVVLTAYNFRMQNLEDVKKAIAHAAKKGLGIVGMKTQAGVYWDKERTKPINMKASLKWALQNENIHTTIPGVTTFDQLEMDVSVMEDLSLTKKELADLEPPPDLGQSGLYCPQCGMCLEQCGTGLDIPTLMRCYMYAYGYRNLYLAKKSLEPIVASGLPCRNCDQCRVSCSMGFDIREKIEDIVSLEHIPDDMLA